MKRYERQIALSGIGLTGQQKLADAKVLVIGAGGLGCPVLQNLTAAGIGTIGIVDGDVIEESNLNRQYLYNQVDCGQMKAIIATQILSKQNPETEIACYPEYFSRQNCTEIASGYNLIVDCTDSISTRYLINDVAVLLGIPMVYASIHKFEGQLSVFNYNNGPTYRCIFPKENLFVPSCNDAGVFGVLPNLLGTMQANEVIKIVLGLGTVLSGKMMLYNSLDNEFQLIEIQKNNDFSVKEIKVRDSISFSDILSIPDALLIDIREEYEEPKLDLRNLKNVPLSKLESFLKNETANRKVVLICQHGERSAIARTYFETKGFVNLFHLEGGIESLKLKKV